MTTMKLTLLIILTFSINLWSKCQEPKPIWLTFNKTVHLIFPKDVYYYDVGSSAILVAQKNAILKLAPKINGFEETNLTVVTVDNVWYTFLLNYKSDIRELTYFIHATDGKKVDGALIKSTDPKNQTTLKTDSSSDTKNAKEEDLIRCCKEIIQKAPSYWNVASSNKKVYFALTNIFINNDKLYFSISLGNASSINYDINFIQMTIVNKKQLKQSSIQEDIKQPLFVYNKTNQLPAKTKELFMVLVYDKFTISDDQKLVFEMYEKKGGRNISFDIKRDLISKAIPIN